MVEEFRNVGKNCKKGLRWKNSSRYLESFVDSDTLVALLGKNYSARVAHYRKTIPDFGTKKGLQNFKYGSH